MNSLNKERMLASHPFLDTDEIQQNRDKLQQLMKRAEKECFVNSTNKVKNLSNVETFEDLTKVY